MTLQRLTSIMEAYASIVHSTLDCCNSIFLNLEYTQLERL